MATQGKSSLLSSLGVTQVDVVTSNDSPSSQRCRAGIVAAMALALGCTLGSPEAKAAGLDAPQAFAAEAAQEHSPSLASRIGGTALSLAIDPHGTIARGVASKAVEATTGDAGWGNQAAELTGAAVGIAATGGALGVVYAGKAIYGAAQYAEQRQEQEIQARAEARAERLASIQQAERMAIWSAEREARGDWAPDKIEADQQRMLRLANDEFQRTGVLSSPELVRRFAVEEQRTSEGKPVEPWYTQHLEFRDTQMLEVERHATTPNADGRYG